MSAEKIFNVGVIGLGEQAWDNLLPSLAVNKNVNIQAVCDLDQKKIDIASRNYGAQPYRLYFEMLEHEQLDALVVASHPSIHSAVLEAAIMRNIPTFVEKPPTLYTKDLEHLIQINTAYQTVTAVGLNFSFAEPIQFLKSLMRTPEFGNPVHLRITHHGNKPDGVMWGLDSMARSFLLSQAIHPLGLLFDLGKPGIDGSIIHANKGSAGIFFDVNTQLIDEDGHVFTAELVTSSISPFFEWQLEIISNKGVIVKINSLLEIEVYSKHRENPMISNQKWWRDLWRPSPLTGGFKRNGYEHQFVSFFESITEGKSNHTGIEKVLPIYYLMDEMELAYENCASNTRE